MQARVDDFAMGTLRSVPSDDPEVLRRTESLRTALTASLVPLEAYIDGLRPHEELLRREEVAWCKEFAARPEESPPISLKEIRAEVAAQRKAEAALEAALPTEMVIGMFSVAVGTLRASLVAKHRACVEQLLLLVAERAREECAVVCKAFGEMHTQVTGCHCHHHRLLYHSHLTPLLPPSSLQLCEQPKDIEKLTEMSEFVATLPARSAELQVQIDSMMEHHELLEETQVTRCHCRHRHLHLTSTAVPSTLPFAV